MKKQLILSFLVVFALAIFAPAAVQAIDNDVVIVNVDSEEKKAEKTKEKKAECTEEKKAECTDKKAEAKKGCSAAKAGCGAK